MGSIHTTWVPQGNSSLGTCSGLVCNILIEADSVPREEIQSPHSCQNKRPRYIPMVSIRVRIRQKKTNNRESFIYGYPEVHIVPPFKRVLANVAGVAGTASPTINRSPSLKFYITITNTSRRIYERLVLTRPASSVATPPFPQTVAIASHKHKQRRSVYPHSSSTQEPSVISS